MSGFRCFYGGFVPCCFVWVSFPESTFPFCLFVKAPCRFWLLINSILCGSWLSKVSDFRCFYGGFVPCRFVWFSFPESTFPVCFFIVKAPCRFWLLINSILCGSWLSKVSGFRCFYGGFVPCCFVWVSFPESTFPFCLFVKAPCRFWLLINSILCGSWLSKVSDFRCFYGGFVPCRFVWFSFPESTFPVCFFIVKAPCRFWLLINSILCGSWLSKVSGFRCFMVALSLAALCEFPFPRVPSRFVFLWRPLVDFGC